MKILALIHDGIIQLVNSDPLDVPVTVVYGQTPDADDPHWNGVVESLSGIALYVTGGSVSTMASSHPESTVFQLIDTTNGCCRTLTDEFDPLTPCKIRCIGLDP